MFVVVVCWVYHSDSITTLAAKETRDKLTSFLLRMRFISLLWFPSPHYPVVLNIFIVPTGNSNTDIHVRPTHYQKKWIQSRQSKHLCCLAADCTTSIHIGRWATSLKSKAAVFCQADSLLRPETGATLASDSCCSLLKLLEGNKNQIKCMR